MQTGCSDWAGGGRLPDKAFLMQELLLRVQHILQRAYRAELSAAKPTVLQLGPRSVDLNDAVVSLPDGKTLALTATELALLRKLAENRGHIVTYDAICDAVWGADYYGYENSLGVHIRHLREKLETEPGAPRFLRTVRGIGYKLTRRESLETFARLIRRYVLAAVGVVLLLLFSGVALLGWLGWQEGRRLPQREYASSEIADAMVETADGWRWGQRTRRRNGWTAMHGPWCWMMPALSGGATSCRRN